MKKAVYLVIILALTCSGISNAQIKTDKKFLNFSDLHFDPFYDSTIVDDLINSDYTEWESIFLNSKDQKINLYRSDSNFPLFKSSMEEMSSRIPDPDFIIITGDFMGHDFSEEYYKYSGIDNIDSLYSFKAKAIKFITSYILKFYPNTLIYPTVGNNDDYCGNYKITPAGDFLKLLSEEWEPMVNINGLNPDFSRDFSKGGYCVLNFPGISNFKMILLNTIYFSPKYINQCGDSLIDPGMEELVWLDSVFQQCTKSVQKVMLSYHIPPGVDIYGTIHGKGDCEDKIFTAWKEEYSEPFIRMINKYSNSISSQFAGHFHRDDFRIFYDWFDPVSFIHITPSISPIYDTNPSYQIFYYDRTESEIVLNNFETYYLKDIESDAPYWTFEYDFNKSYDESTVTPLSMHNISEKIFNDEKYRTSYIEYYTAMNAGMTVKDMSNWYYNWCGFGHLTKADYANCMCGDSVRVSK
ncbi:MAG: metallophosphoesterase [Ignavibacteria bacterium]